MIGSSVCQTGNHFRLANIQKKQGMGGLHRRAVRPKGNAFARGGAGRQRSCQHGPKAKALPASAGLIQDCSRRSRIGFGWPGEGAPNAALLSARSLALAGRQQVHEIAGRLAVVSIFERRLKVRRGAKHVKQRPQGKALAAVLFEAEIDLAALQTRGQRIGTYRR